jgi:hypothetical protein
VVRTAANLSPAWSLADFASAIEPGPARRGRLYHVQHKPLYEAIGQPDTRNRRLQSIGRMVERVMILDAVLGDRRCWWLGPEADKRTFFGVTQATGLRPEDYPHITFGLSSRRSVRSFPDKLPIGIEKAVGIQLKHTEAKHHRPERFQPNGSPEDRKCFTGRTLFTQKRRQERWSEFFGPLMCWETRDTSLYQVTVDARSKVICSNRPVFPDCVPWMVPAGSRAAAPRHFTSRVRWRSADRM